MERSVCRSMNDVYENFGRILTYHRSLKDLTQSEVADRMGISQSAYAYFEAGKRRIPLADIMKLADVLDFNVNEVMGILKDEKRPPSKWFPEFDDVEFSPEEVTEISNFIKYVISKRG